MTNSSLARPAVFLDRDGVICEFVEELDRWEQFRFRSGVAEAIRKLNESGHYVFVATNQPNIARGKMTWQTLVGIHDQMLKELASEGAKIDRVYFCPHRLGGRVQQYAMDCPCRKPKPGMLELAARDFSIDTSRSLMIGDTWRDMVCAQQFGILGLGVKGGGGFPYAANREEARHQPKQLFEGPLEAVNWWLEQKTPSVS